MITRVYGNINGVGVMPVVNIGDKYYFQPPETLTGRYVCEFWAEDDFGNVGYNAAILTLVRGVIKCVEVLSKDFQITMRGDPMRTRMYADAYCCDIHRIPALNMFGDCLRLKMLPITCKRDMVEALG